MDNDHSVAFRPSDDIYPSLPAVPIRHSLPPLQRIRGGKTIAFFETYRNFRTLDNLQIANVSAPLDGC